MPIRHGDGGPGVEHDGASACPQEHNRGISTISVSGIAFPGAQMAAAVAVDVGHGGLVRMVASLEVQYQF
jgi:hypothetical protein